MDKPFNWDSRMLVRIPTSNDNPLQMAGADVATNTQYTHATINSDKSSNSSSKNAGNSSSRDIAIDTLTATRMTE